MQPPESAFAVPVEDEPPELLPWKMPRPNPEDFALPMDEFLLKPFPRPNPEDAFALPVDNDFVLKPFPRPNPEDAFAPPVDNDYLLKPMPTTSVVTIAEEDVKKKKARLAAQGTPVVADNAVVPEIDLMQSTSSELRNILRGYDIVCDGTKEELVERILNYEWLVRQTHMH